MYSPIYCIWPFVTPVGHSINTLCSQNNLEISLLMPYM